MVVYVCAAPREGVAHVSARRTGVGLIGGDWVEDPLARVDPSRIVREEYASVLLALDLRGNLDGTAATKEPVLG